MQERPRKCKSGVPTLNGSRSLCTAENTSAISKRLTDALMYSKERMSKDRRFRFTTDTMEPTRDGRLDMLILSRLKPRV